jgi:hypothetical protein
MQSASCAWAVGGRAVQVHQHDNALRRSGYKKTDCEVVYLRDRPQLVHQALLCNLLDDEPSSVDALVLVLVRVLVLSSPVSLS